MLAISAPQPSSSTSPADATLPHLRKFPGGRVEPGETDQQALVRELMERLGVEVKVAEREVEVDHACEGYSLQHRSYRCPIESGEPRARWSRPSRGPRRRS